MTERTDIQPTPPLRRSRRDRVVGGVAAGIARRIDLPPWVIRVAFVFLAIFGGFGIALYVTGWLLIPDEGQDEPIVRGLLDRVHGATGWIGIALIALAVLVLIDATGFLRGDLTLAAILIVIGVLLYRGDLGRSRTPDGEGPVDPGSDAGPMPERPVAPAPASAPDEAPPAAGAIDAAIRPPAPVRPRSPLGRITFAATLLLIGAMWLADTAVAAFDPAPRHYLGVAVGAVGLGLLVGAWIGRARGLIVLGVLLTPLLLVSPLLEGGIPGSVGERRFAATTPGELAPRYELGAGRLVMDLRGLRMDGAEDRVEVFVGFGELEIRLPDGVGVEVDARIGAGDLRVGDQLRSGLGREIREVLPGSDGLLRIDIEMNVGDVQVTRAGVRADRSSGAPFDQRIVVTDEDELDRVYDFDAGTVLVDLRDLRLTEPALVSIGLGAGKLKVVLPAGTAVDGDASVGFGSLDVLGDVRDGVGIDGSFHTPGDTPGLRLDLELGSGDLIVEAGS